MNTGDEFFVERMDLGPHIAEGCELQARNISARGEEPGRATASVGMLACSACEKCPIEAITRLKTSFYPPAIRGSLKEDLAALTDRLVSQTKDGCLRFAEAD